MGVRVILYVEDDDAAFTLVSIILKEHAPDIRLLRARDGEEALTMLRAPVANLEIAVPDLILLDLNLPKKGGFEVLSDLKRDPSLLAIPVVIFSTSYTERDRNHALGKGAEDYITKPSSFELLVEAVKTACFLPRSPK